MNLGIGVVSLWCRFIRSALIAGPVLYHASVTEGDVYHFFILVLLAPVAGLVLLANSLFCLFRHRSWKSTSFSLIFIFVGAIGLLTARYYLPQFRMSLAGRVSGHPLASGVRPNKTLQLNGLSSL